MFLNPITFSTVERKEIMFLSKIVASLIPLHFHLYTGNIVNNSLVIMP